MSVFLLSFFNTWTDETLIELSQFFPWLLLLSRDGVFGRMTAVWEQPVYWEVVKISKSGEVSKKGEANIKGGSYSSSHYAIYLNPYRVDRILILQVSSELVLFYC